MKQLTGLSALGYFLSPTPAVGDFCILTALGMFIDFIFQVTFFAAIMVYSGKREHEGGLIAYFPWMPNCCKPTLPEEEADNSCVQQEKKAVESFHERKHSYGIERGTKHWYLRSGTGAEFRRSS